MYILQKGLIKYFKEIDINNTVIISNNACECMLFDNVLTAIKFRNVLLLDYNIDFQIIKI